VKELKELNDRLAREGGRVKIEVKSNRLCLRATLPPKPGKSGEPYQQRIYLGIAPTSSGLKRAEKEARKISALLDCKEFSWEPYLKEPEPEPEQLESQTAIEQFHQDYLDRGGTEQTWKTDYWIIFKRLDGDVTPDNLLAIVKATTPNTRIRQRACVACNALAKFLGLEIDFAPYKGNYSSYQSTQQRDIPTDEAIVAAYELLPSPWRWVYGMMAAYGLRNHEAFRLDLKDFPIIQVAENTKTGFREVWPCPADWIDLWNLKAMVLPNVKKEQENGDIGHRVTVQFNRSKIPFKPYDLRHAWAIRTLEYCWPVELAAQMMGHSVEVHTRTYQRWITRERKQKIFDMLTSKTQKLSP
jgi:integrase